MANVMICGIDEAGRGPAMGPLVVGAVFARDDASFREMGVRDSKKLSPAVREKLYSLIEKECESFVTVIASAADIDERRKRQSLNEIEMDMFAEAALRIPADIVYADCPDVDESRFSWAMSARIGAKVVAEHKADDAYPIVSAASIVAKVVRDRMMLDISEEFGTDVGSGYPSDRRTMDFIEKWIKENGRPPTHTRCSWEPVIRLMSVSKNTRISDW
ncbi:MAG: ribonuclease HII [Candidatus Methanoplasma sp.]|jgi:ribonuclease HII|nr:ribonuclease HII [Candidatus Methanoplasma sp.]